MPNCIIEEISESGLKAYKAIFNSDIPYDEKVKKMIELKLSNSHEISQELLDDIYKNQDEEYLKQLNISKRKMFGIYLDDFERLRKGEIRDDIKPEFILFFLNNLQK